MPADPEKYPDGLIVKRPRSNAPDFVVGSISIKTKTFLQWLSTRNTEWVNLDIKVSSFGEDEEGNKKWYAQVDAWVKPSERVEEKEDEDALPF
jgi:hypothetical protein